MRESDTRIQIEADTRALALPAGRRVGQPGHDTARNYLEGRLGSIGLAPFSGDSYALGYEANSSTGRRSFTNLVGVVPGRDRSLRPLLVGAHYDSVIDAPCADDNATAVAVALAAAEEFTGGPLERDLVVALFDAEEPPYFLTPAMGSSRFYEDHCQGIDFQCALIMDLIGHDVELGNPALEKLRPGLRDLLFVLGSESHEILPPAVASAADEVKGLRILPTLNSYVGDLSDHHAFRVAGQPYVFLSCGQGRHYHTPLDDMSWINLEKVERVSQFVSAFLRALDFGPESALEDQAEFEIRLIERALGGTTLKVLQQFGLPELRSREDLDRLAQVLTGSLVV